MTDYGTFIINGAERVIVSQLHRSPGVLFSSSIHANGRPIYSARIIPNRGAWIEFEIDISRLMWVMIDRRRKIPATTFLRIFGIHHDDDLIKEFFETASLTLDNFGKGATKVADLENFMGEEFIEERPPQGRHIFPSQTVEGCQQQQRRLVVALPDEAENRLVPEFPENGLTLNPIEDLIVTAVLTDDQRRVLPVALNLSRQLAAR